MILTTTVLIAAGLLLSWAGGAFRRERFEVTVAGARYERGDLVTLRAVVDDDVVESDFVVVRRDGDALTLRRPSPWRQWMANLRRQARQADLRRAVRP